MITPMPNPEYVYKIVSRAAFDAAAAEGVFPQMPIDLRDGYVHMSTAGQLAETLRLHFVGQSDLVVFAVATAQVAGLRWENSRGGQLFPHGYGVLSPKLIGRQAIVAVGAGGTVTLPEWIT
jgi:uncharacterized protein (DUF952 family)